MVYPNRVVLNINQKYVMPIPYTQQGDTARVLTFNILDKGVPFNLTGKTVRAKILKPDNMKCYNDLTITNATGGECDLKLTNQVLAVAGKVNCQLEIKEGEELLSTIIFPIDVEPSIDINGAAESTNEFTALLNGIIKLDEWDKYFKEASGKIEEKYTERLNGIDSSLEESKVQITNLNNNKLEKNDAETNYAKKVDISSMVGDKASKAEVEVERRRIDNIIALPPNTSINNARLEDIAVGADGKIYSSPGEAVREQFNSIVKGSSNLINLQDKTYLSDVVNVSSEKGTSVLKLSANGTTTTNKTFQIFMDSSVTNKNLTLKPNTQYTISAKRKSGTCIDTRAISLIVKRRDTLVNVTTLNFGQVMLGNQQSTTFTTPDFDKYYLEFVFATGAFNFNAEVNLNLTIGENASYEEYGIDLADSLKIKKDIELLKKLVYGIYDIIVAKDGSGDYTTLTEAVEHAKDFDVIYVKNGNYENEIVKAWLKTVFIIGESKTGVIISNTTGEYATPPVEMGTGLLRNLTIHAKKIDGVTPSNKCYALHSESSVTNYGYFEIDNCDIISDWRQGWGMGMRGGTVYKAINTDFNGGVYFHDCEHSHRATKQAIMFDNCNMYRLDNGAGLLLQDQQMPTAEVIVAFRRCMVKSKLGKSVLFKKWTGGDVIDATGWSDFPTWTLDFTSWGNNESIINS